MSIAKEMVGKKFSRLEVIERVPNSKNPRKFLCLCDCGNQPIVAGKDLRSGNTKSCGCAQVEAIKRTIQKNIKHGLWGTKTYKAFIGAKNRCGKDKDYLNVRFLFSSIEEFISEIGICPPGLELDRIDPYDDYRPGNIRWAKKPIQSVNKKVSKLNTTGATGVFFDKKHGKYFSKISFEKERYYLGYFDNFLEARIAYLNHYYIFHNEWPPEIRI